MQVTFDPEKNRINQRDHDGVSLAEVEAVFFDPFAITLEDRDRDEERFVTLGTRRSGEASGGRVLLPGR